MGALRRWVAAVQALAALQQAFAVASAPLQAVGPATELYAAIATLQAAADANQADMAKWGVNPEVDLIGKLLGRQLDLQS